MNKKDLQKIILPILCAICTITQLFAQVKVPSTDAKTFEASNIQLVTDGSNELGLLTQEYTVINGKGEVMTLLYLPKNNREIDFTVGYKTNEAKKIVFDPSNNTAKEVLVEEEWHGALYLTVEGTLSYNPIQKANNAQLRPYLLEDKRKEEVERYALAKIGTQIWMRENLRTALFNDGTAITTNLPKDQWEATKSPAVTYYDGNEANKTKMGALYNWYAVINETPIAPKGWGVPQMQDWEALAKYIDPKGAMTFDYETASLSYTAGEMLKSQTEWIKPSTASGTLLPGNNATMLDMKPYGSTSTSKYFNGYSGLNRQAYFWTSTISDYSDTKALFIRLYWDSHTINSYMDDKFMGYSVRCIAQTPLSLGPWQEVKKEELNLKVSSAGSLFSMVQPNQFASVKSLTLRGELDARDFATIRRFVNLQTLSLSEISIKAYKGAEGTLAGVKQYHISEIPAESFKGMTSLQSFSASGEIESFGAKTFEGCSALSDVTLPNTLTEFAGSNFTDCTTLHSIVLPTSLSDLGMATFKGCISLTKVSMPETITEIGDEVFASCRALSQIVLPKDLTEIGTSAFEGCTSLTEVILPENVSSIGMFCFAQCGKLKNVTLNEKLEEIGYGAFLNNALLAQLRLPNQLKELGAFSLQGCTALTNLSLPLSLSRIGNGAFRGTNILFTLPQNSQYKLYNRMLMSADGKIVYNLPTDHSETVIVPEGVEVISGAAFADCKSLTHIDLPSTLTEIKLMALENTALYHIILRVKNPTTIKLGEEVFGKMDYARCDLLVPESSLDLYRSTQPWNLFKLSKITSTAAIDNAPSLYVSILENTIIIHTSKYIGQILSLYAGDGHLVKSIPISSAETSIPAEELASGLYVIQIGAVAQKINIR